MSSPKKILLDITYITFLKRSPRYCRLPNIMEKRERKEREREREKENYFF